MPFIPHTEPETREMLDVIGVDRIEDLFDEIPQHLRCDALQIAPPALSEMEVAQLMGQRAREDGQPCCFIGAGAYDHHIPAAVWQIASRGEFYSAYTPYQAEASQGTLQLLYEFQSMMAALTAMDVSNASLYDGASGLAEAVLMAVRANRKSRSGRVLVPRSLNPAHRRVVHSITHNQGIVLQELPFDLQGGHTDLAALESFAGQDFAALVIPQPNYFGILEEVDELCNWARANGALSIAVVNPLAMALLSPPGEWGLEGVDICCGEGQPLGAPLASGGPYFGFLCCRKRLVRQMSGRIIGRTLDVDGKPGFTPTLQAREQHIRRSRATSNICTNQGLMVTAATIHMSLLGAEGMRRTAAACHSNTDRLTRLLCSLPGVAPRFQGAFFHERVITLPVDADNALRALAAHNILGGLNLVRDYPELENTILTCATERRTHAEMQAYGEKLARVVSLQGGTPCQLQPKDW